jgi:hypothetical protein
MAVATNTTWKKKSEHCRVVDLAFAGEDVLDGVVAADEEAQAGMTALSPSPYMMLYPMNMYMTQAIEYRATFFSRISAVLLLRTRPASSIEKPAAIHMTSAPDHQEIEGVEGVGV